MSLDHPRRRAPALGSMAASPCSTGERRAQCSVRTIHRHRGTHRRGSLRSAVLAAPIAAWAIACDGPASLEASPEATPWGVSAVSEPLRARLAGTPSTHCNGAPLPECPSGFTGPSCTLPCTSTSPEPGVPPSCAFDLYCHGDGSVYGLAAHGALLYDGSPSAPAEEALAALIAFVTTHEEDLGLPPGLEAQHLGLAPAPGFPQRMGGLVVHRFVQTYRTLPVLPPDDVVQVVYGPSGAIQLTGQIIDGRRDYDHHDQQARQELVERSVRHHAHVRTSLPASEIVVEAPTRVAMPETHAVAWMARARHVGGAVLARVLVAADPVPAGPILPLVSWRRAEVEDLATTVPIEVLTANPATDPALPAMSVETTLTDGSALLGSIDDASGDVQLASEDVVVLDLGHGSFLELDAVASRISSPSGEFLEASGAAFDGQLTYHLLRSWYAAIDERLTVPGTSIRRWDSAVPAYVPGAQSPTPPGTFRPRVLAFVDSLESDCPATAVACASIGGYSYDHPHATSFPELVHQPPGAAPDYEVTGRIHIHDPNEAGDAIVTLAHEFGHMVDLFAGPGFTVDVAPDCGDACAFECVEDTSDEAPALGETIAQMVGMVLLQSSFEPVGFEYCELVGMFSRSNVKAFDPGPCMPPDEDTCVLQRDGACSKSSPYCDKPELPGFRFECCDPALDAGCVVAAPLECPATGHQRQVPTGLCHTSPGYDAHSVLQAFWQLLHGQRCEPTVPFTCQPYAWPGGVSPADAIVPAFLHSLRLGPLSYDQLFDGMAAHVACTHGIAAYEHVNAVLCAHGIRDCDEPVPLVCETCGNGIREGAEACDGLDWAATSCEDFDGYVDGDLSCDPATCQLVLEQCIAVDDGADDTTGAEHGTEGNESVGAATDGFDIGTEGPTGPEVGDPGGCSCRADSRSRSGALALVGLLACFFSHLRRNRSWHTQA